MTPEQKNIYKALLQEMAQQGKTVNLTTEVNANPIIYSNVITQISNLTFSVEIYSSQFIQQYITMVNELDNFGISHASLDGETWTDFHCQDIYPALEYSCSDEQSDGINLWFYFSGQLFLGGPGMNHSELISTSPTNYYTRIFIRKSGTSTQYFNYNPMTEAFGYAYFMESYKYELILQ